MSVFMKYLKDRIQGKAPKGAKRSPQWKEVREKHLKENPQCFICAGTDKVEVHHVVPFHIAPDLELNPDNLISLCEAKKYGINCHLLIGHLGNYSVANLDVKIDSQIWRMKLGKHDKAKKAA